MFSKEYKIKDEHIKDKQRVIFFAAMMGERDSGDEVVEEKEGHREVFYMNMDATGSGVPFDAWKEVAKKHLRETLISFDLTPLEEAPKMDSVGVEKAIVKGYMANKVKKQFLIHQLNEIEDKQGAALAEMVDSRKESIDQQPKSLLMN